MGNTKTIIRVDDLKEGKNNLSVELKANDIKFEYPDTKIVSPILVELFIEKVRNKIIISGDVSTSCEFVCSRCLSEYKKEIVAKITRTEKYEKNKVIDFADDVLEAIILLLPMKYLCKENCLGLCPHCGENRNLGNCKCNNKE
jgi:uncharacterized protein